jgi:predicted phage terminase large subunit-like protein
VGIVVAGLGTDGEAYVLEDLTVKAPPNVWGRIVVAAFHRHDADAIVAETNFGGAMVAEVVRAAAVDAGVRVNFKEVKASRGKVVRAEPVAVLYGQAKVHHVGSFPLLEDELTSFTSAGYMGDRSPDRADALIWALSELFPRVLSAERNKNRREVLVETCSDYSPFGGGLPHN